MLLLVLRNSQQTFSIELNPETGEPMIRFSTSAIRRYTIEVRDDLISGSWADLFPLFDGTGSEMSGSVPSDGLQRYYRLRIELP